MQWWKEWVDSVCVSLPAVTVATFGGAISYLSTRSGDNRFSWYWFLVGTASAAFVGVIMHCALNHYDISQGVKSAVIGIGGYASNDILILLKKRLLERLRKGLLK